MSKTGSSVMWTWLKNNEAQMKIVLAVFGALYVAIEYNASVEKQSRDRALQYIEAHRSGRIAEANQRLREFWLSQDMQKWTAHLLERRRDGRVNPALYHAGVNELLRHQGLRPSVYEMLGFYRDVAVCVNAESCDDEIPCNFLFDDMQAFRENYRDFVEGLEHTLGDLSGVVIRDFLKRTCASQHRAYCADLPGSADCRA